MSDWLISLEGTEAGHQAALFLAIWAAFLHAVFGALQKGRHDPWLSRGAIDFSYCVMAAPFALFVVPWPEPHMWLIFFVAWVIHVFYKLFQALAYTKGSYTVVYPVVRGTGPLFTVIGSFFLFGEVFTHGAMAGGRRCCWQGSFGLAGYNYRYLTVNRDTLGIALGLAVVTGLFVAAYTTYDAYGIRATADPFTFLAWFFMIDGLVFPVIAFSPLAQHGGTACSRAADGQGLLWRAGGVCVLWRHHAGHKAGQGGGGGGAARDLHRVCRADRLAGAEGNRGAAADCPDGFDRAGRRDSGNGRLKPARRTDRRPHGRVRRSTRP